MQIRKLPANQAWAATIGDQIIPIDRRHIYDTRSGLIEAIERIGLQVDATGTISVRSEGGTD